MSGASGSEFVGASSELAVSGSEEVLSGSDTVSPCSELTISDEASVEEVCTVFEVVLFLLLLLLLLFWSLPSVSEGREAVLLSVLSDTVPSVLDEAFDWLSDTTEEVLSELFDEVVEESPEDTNPELKSLPNGRLPSSWNIIAIPTAEAEIITEATTSIEIIFLLIENTAFTFCHKN